jgi:hypothetical protein
MDQTLRTYGTTRFPNLEPRLPTFNPGSPRPPLPRKTLANMRNMLNMVNPFLPREPLTDGQRR